MSILTSKPSHKNSLLTCSTEMRDSQGQGDNRTTSLPGTSVSLNATNRQSADFLFRCCCGHLKLLSDNTSTA